jgi:uncharacterized membrane protein
MFTLFTETGLEFLFRWVHFMAGITWIGMLFYFNFVQGEWFKEIEAPTKSQAIQKLVPRALWWFRWGAMFTFLSGFFILAYRGHNFGFEIFKTSWGISILLGAALGTTMFLNVWLVIWPNQKIVIASAQQVAQGGQADPKAAESAGKALLASRTNTLFSLPMLFFMGAASHLPFNVDDQSQFSLLFLLFFIILGLLEFNALKGKLGPLTSVKGVIHCSLGLTVALYFLVEVLM